MGTSARSFAMSLMPSPHWSQESIARLVEPRRVHRAVYTDPALFALETERIFRRTWLYVGHESAVPKPGDYILTRLGPDPVILVRTEDGALALLHNRCAHRGATVVTAPAGHARVFRCPYHAWSFRLNGTLIGVPLAEGYPPEFDRAHPQNSLERVARVASYRGFVFASHAAAGPDLPTFLGGLGSALDNMVDRAPAGTLSQLGGTLQLAYRGNWKLFMENATDLVHPGFVHASSVAAARKSPEALTADSETAQTAQMLLSNGLGVAEWDAVPLHAFAGGHLYMGGFYRQGLIAPERSDPVYAAYRAALVGRHGETKTAEVLGLDRFNNLLWPNVSVNSRFGVLRVVQPVAVDRTIVIASAFRFDGAPAEMAALTLQFLNTAASAASLVASDDLAVFERCQHGLMHGAGDWIDASRGALADRTGADGSVRSSGTSELPMRHQLAAWHDWMCRP